MSLRLSVLPKISLVTQVVKHSQTMILLPAIHRDDAFTALWISRLCTEAYVGIKDIQLGVINRS